MKINDMLAPPPVHLPVDPVAELLARADGPVRLSEIAQENPASSGVWAHLAEHALAEGRTIEGYAYARTGYHRGLDALRANGWKGFGPVPASHEPNRAVLRAIAALAKAAKAIGEDHEYDRCRALLSDCDPESVSELLDS
ncbi:DUF3151 domain-containing protein [Corynebacterium aquilae]|uniref:DUF3151 domain-containing protein n=1 Tax=Corynebacterium aquilae DSM 44791 TaxID=1431546 RepID=A0A1L7CE94_9CORY|nr:DUF3151 domain-containing protein [Corynebacterium aquilae]APT84157.1 hypothetical protein CAQU_02700 [Corynebacterium aquilae DSM 44791]